MGCLGKLSKRPSIRKQIALSLSSQLIVLSFLRNSHLQRDIYQQAFFWQYFCQLLENSCSASNLQKVHKKHPSRILILIKLQAFTEAATGGVQLKMAFLERSSQNSKENICVRDYFNKFAGLVFSSEFSVISKNIFFPEHLWTTASAFSFSEAATGGVL